MTALRAPVRVALRNLADLVLPRDCPGCARHLPSAPPGLCPACLLAVEAHAPFPTVPDPPPPGMPACHAGGPYAGTLRDVLIAYKEHGRVEARPPLARLLARAVGSLTRARAPVLVPVPTTRAARRARGGDHLGPLAAGAATLLGGGTAPCLRARSRPDSVGQDREARLASAFGAYAPAPLRRPPRGVPAVIVDDVVTSGATLSAVARALAELGVHVIGAAVVAATPLRREIARSVRADPPTGGRGGLNLWLHGSVGKSDSGRPTGDTQVISS